MPTERESAAIPAPPSEGPAHMMDDFQVIEERRRVMTTLAVLTDRYRELNQEINKRSTLQWMLAR
jgi:hypothetical protein